MLRRSLLVGVICVLSAVPLALGQQASELAKYIEQSHAKQSIVRPAKGLLKHEYLVPDGPYFQLFDWDMYFMGVALSYDKVGTPVASSVEDFLEFTDENWAQRGYTPREVAPEGMWALPEMCKPFLAQAALRASLTMNDFSWLEQLSGKTQKSNYTKLVDTVGYWEDARRSPDGFFRWADGVESGVDNNPAVADVPAVTTEGVDLQCYLYREYRALAYLAGKLHKDADAAVFTKRAEELRTRVQQKMWSEADGMFLNIDSWTGKPVRIRTWTNMVPLWAGIATPTQAKRMIEEHLLNPAEFWSPYGVRTLSKTEALYNPVNGYWRGPVWVISNYMMMHGLMNYGYPAQAKELAAKTVAKLVDDYATSGGMNENYSPETGKAAAAGHFLSWNLLAEHMVDEAASGGDAAAVPGK